MFIRRSLERAYSGRIMVYTTLFTVSVFSFPTPWSQLCSSTYSQQTIRVKKMILMWFVISPVFSFFLKSTILLLKVLTDYFTTSRSTRYLIKTIFKRRQPNSCPENMKSTQSSIGVLPFGNSCVEFSATFTLTGC